MSNIMLVVMFLFNQPIFFQLNFLKWGAFTNYWSNEKIIENEGVVLVFRWQCPPCVCGSLNDTDTQPFYCGVIVTSFCSMCKQISLMSFLMFIEPYQHSYILLTSITFIMHLVFITCLLWSNSIKNILHFNACDKHLWMITYLNDASPSIIEIKI